MRLKRIEVSGFRGFASKQEFNLSSDAIIVVGANGFGKTSLLDAVQWGLCGRLGRLGKGDDKVLSLYSNTGQARVSLTLQNVEDEISITRVFDGENQDVWATIDGRELKGASAKARIFERLWPEAGMAKDGEESLSLALTRSVYLQQDRLRSFLEGADNQERFNVISELVGAGRLTELQTQLEKESRSWSTQTNKLNKEQSPLSDRVDNLKSQLNKLLEASKLGEQLSESIWSHWWATAKEFDISISEVPSPVSTEAGSLLDRTIRELQALRDQNKRRHTFAEQTKDLVNTPPAKPRNSIQELKKQLDTAIKASAQAKLSLKAAQEKAAEIRKSQIAAKEETEQKRALAQLALQLLDDKCPVCRQDYDSEKTRERLQGILDEEVAISSGYTDEPINIEEFAEKEKQAVQSEARAKKLLDETTGINKSFLMWEKECDDRLTELRVKDLKDVNRQIEELLGACNDRGELLKELVTEGEQLSLNLARESANARIKSTEADLKNAQNALAMHRLFVSKREVTSATVKLLIEQLREARSKVVVDKLTEIEPLLQRIFARIDPHPTFRAVRLATEFSYGKGRLDAEIHDSLEEKFSKSPEIIFSSSQLNALAVSIFLSFNLALPNLPLQVAMLDDPIQSLDDINLLGLVDLLRRAKDRRQILVSTHDARFGQLIARKLRPASSSHTTTVIELRGWKPTGPDVIQYPIEADVIPLRLAAV